MGGGAKKTSIPDPEGAKSALVAFGAHAEKLQSDLKTHTDKITSLEAGKPWGDTEYGKSFEKAYNAGNGADFVKNNVNIVAREMAEGGAAAYVAVSNSVELDQVDLKNLFTVKGSDGTATGPGSSTDVGNKMNSTNDAYNTEMNKQNQAAQG